MQPVQPIHIVELWPQLHAELIALLRGLRADDWHRPTAAPLWMVKDIAAHLLDGDIRRLSFQRDGLPLLSAQAPIAGYRELVDFLNELNADWVKAARRFSPRLLTDLMELTGAEVGRLFSTLDPFGLALFGVAWAGDEQSLNWFDTAREFTEKWHHQQQIRDAVGAPPLSERKWLYPVLDTFLRGLPHTYRHTLADEGASIDIHLAGTAGGEWALVRQAGAWRLFAGRGDAATTSVTLDQDAAWRLFTKGLTRAAARERAVIAGDEALGVVLLDLLAVMA